MDRLLTVRSTTWASMLLAAMLIGAGDVRSQKVFTLNEVLDSIERQSPMGKMYDADIRSMNAAAKGAKSWMPPELGGGLYMTPYSPSYWKQMDGEAGMGSFMFSIQQMIPNRKKLNADAAYMLSMAGATEEQKIWALHGLYMSAKKAYYDWVIIEKKKAVLNENEKILDFMIRNAEIRYRNGLEKISAYYKAKAALGTMQTMRIMLWNEGDQKRILLNTLMARSPDAALIIDTSGLHIRDVSGLSFESIFRTANRSDIKAIDKQILSLELKQRAEEASLKPQFGIRFEHIAGFSGQPQQFTLMGMVRLPYASWASGMTRSNIESARWRIESLQSEKLMMLQDAAGMATKMKIEIIAKQKQVALYEKNILPALRNNYKTILLAYEQNTEDLFMLFDAWETLNMTQSLYLDQLQQLMQLQAELDQILQIRN